MAPSVPARLQETRRLPFGYFCWLRVISKREVTVYVTVLPLSCSVKSYCCVSWSVPGATVLDVVGVCCSVLLEPVRPGCDAQALSGNKSVRVKKMRRRREKRFAD